MVGSWRGPHGVVVRVQPVDGPDDVKAVKVRPSRIHFSEGARYKLDVCSARQKGRNHQLQLAKAEQRVATNDGQVQRLEPIDDFKHSVHERLASSVVQVAQCLSAAKMRRVIGVTARTFQGAFLGDFYGKRGWFTLEDFAPGLKDFRCLHR